MIKGDTGSLDYSSYRAVQALRLRPKIKDCFLGGGVRAK